MSEQGYFVRSRGKVTGPFGWEQLRARAAKGQLSRFDEVSQDRQSWQAAARVRGLFDAGAVTARPADPPARAEPADEWYYLDANQQRWGPVSWEQLEYLGREGKINDATQVSRPGMSEWVSLSSLRRSAAAGPAPAGDEALGWQRVRLGFGLLLLAVFVRVGMWLLSAAGAVLAQLIGENNPNGPVVLTATNILTQLLSLAALALDAVGLGFCAMAPKASGARVLGIAALCTAIAGPVISLLQIVLLIAAGTEAAGMVGLGGLMNVRRLGGVVLVLVLLGALGTLLWVATQFLTLFFIRAVGLYLQAARTVQSSQYLAGLLGVTVLLCIALVGVLVALATTTETVMSGPVLGAFISCGGVVLLVWLVVVIWYVLLLFQGRRVLGDHLGRV